MKSGKQLMSDGMELRSKDRIRTLEEKNTYEYFVILKANTTK